MKFVIDTNEIFSFFNEKSKARSLSTLPNLELHSPFFALEEIKKHKSDIIERFSLSDEQYALILKLVEFAVKFSKEERYHEFIEEAKTISPDPNDVEYFALALKLDCPFWSEDKLLKRQNKVKVISTSEINKETGLK